MDLLEKAGIKAEAVKGRKLRVQHFVVPLPLDKIFLTFSMLYCGSTLGTRRLQAMRRQLSPKTQYFCAMICRWQDKLASFLASVQKRIRISYERPLVTRWMLSEPYRTFTASARTSCNARPSPNLA